MRPRRSRGAAAVAVASERPASGTAEKVFLFTTKTCPNCRIAKTELDRAGIPYQVVDAAERKDLTARFGVRQAPTLVLVTGEEATSLVGASAIKKYAVNRAV